MKKVILTLVVIAGLSASCKKTYTCYCSDGTTPTVKASSTVNAENDCIAKGTSSVTCVVQ